MNTDWQNFLEQHGAICEAGVVRHFGDSAAELAATARGTVLCDLSQFSALRVSGVDAQTFLQNLLSNDIQEASNARAQLSSFNTAKGRVLATLLIWREGDDYILQLPRILSEPMRKKLSMYVLRAKVKIADAGDEIISLGLSGADAQAMIEKHFGELPEPPLGVSGTPQANVIMIDGDRFQINTRTQQAGDLWEELSTRAQPVGSICWEWLDIRRGIPAILPPTQEKFVAQMLNFDVIGGVSFKKGCYPGQEIVARMQYLGHLKRRTYLAHIDGAHFDGAHVGSSDIPQPGDELFSADMEGQPSGMIVNATPAPGGGCDVLAVVQIASRETQKVHWKSPGGEELHFLSLPYALPNS